jgi:hypothetical protein
LVPASNCAGTEGARVELRCGTAKSLTIARLPLICSTRQWLDRMDMVPFGWCVSTLHGVVFHFLHEVAAAGLAGRERSQRTDSALPFAA